MRPRRILTLAVLSLVSSFLVAAETFTGEVVGVSYGDTITVLADGRQYRVRLHGIDCPESGQDYGTKAKQFTSAVCFGQRVDVRVKGEDRYGRTIGLVTLPRGEILNHELVRAGLAWWYREYAPGDRTLRQLEAEAKEAKRGLWEKPYPTPPWEFRRTDRTIGAADVAWAAMWYSIGGRFFEDTTVSREENRAEYRACGHFLCRIICILRIAGAGCLTFCGRYGTILSVMEGQAVRGRDCRIAPAQRELCADWGFCRTK